MRVRYNRLAEDEVIKAAEYFDAQQEGLGNRFLDEIDEAVVKSGLCRSLGR